MTNKQSEIFDGKVKVLHTGTEFGCVHPSDPKFGEQLYGLKRITGQRKILAPKLGFNTRVTPIADDSPLSAAWGEESGFLRTREASDGVVVSITGETLMKIAVMIMNADCGTIEILAPNGELAVLHGALDCVDNRDGSSIVKNAVQYFVGKGFAPSQLKFRMGEAAQPCCYGIDDRDRADEIAETYGPDVVGAVKNPPRIGQYSIDIPSVAVRQADKAGVRDIEVENLCTSCHGLAESVMNRLDTFGDWYSNLREDRRTANARGYGMRNAVVVW